MDSIRRRVEMDPAPGPHRGLRRVRQSGRRQRDKRPDEATPTVRHERQEPYPRRSGQIHRPAGKHGISDHTSTPLASNTGSPSRSTTTKPARELRLGFDTHGRLLEIVVVLLDDETELAIHAMKARPQYLDLLP